MQPFLEICKDALEEIGEHEVPETIVGNPNPTARQVLAIANREGKLLSRRHNWTALQVVYTFTTVSGTSEYDLPVDFDRFCNDTQWDRANNWQMVGPTTPSQWQYLKSAIVTEGIRRLFAVIGDKIHIHPEPTVTGDTLTFTYISKHWCASSAGDGQLKFAADTDVPLLPDHLFHLGVKWRFLKEKGVPSEVDYGEYENEVRRAISRDGGAPVLCMTGPRIGGPDTGVNIPDTGYGT